MLYLYGKFSDEQINKEVKAMHNDVHKLLLYKDRNVSEIIFNTDEEFLNYFNNLLFRFGGLNKLLGEPEQMIELMSTLQAAYDLVQSDTFNYSTFRRAILDSHGYIKAFFESGDDYAKS